MKIFIQKEYVKEAYNYAVKSKHHLSDRHSFHSGSLNDRQKKMFEGTISTINCKGLVFF